MTGDDYDMYYEIWQQFDPEGSQYIRYSQLSDFLDVLEPPLQIHKPNKFKIISMDIPICRGDLCFCVDVLDALTKDFFARKGNPVEETAELGEVTAQADRPGYEPISSTLWRQREEYCARMIQSVWRKQFKFTADMIPSRNYNNLGLNGNSKVIIEVTERLERNMSREREPLERKVSAGTEVPSVMPSRPSDRDKDVMETRKSKGGNERREDSNDVETIVTVEFER